MHLSELRARNFYKNIGPDPDEVRTEQSIHRNITIEHVRNKYYLRGKHPDLESISTSRDEVEGNGGN